VQVKNEEFEMCGERREWITEFTLDPKWVRLAPNGTNPRIFSDQIQYILAGTPLTHFGPKFGHPGVSCGDVKMRKCNVERSQI